MVIGGLKSRPSRAKPVRGYRSKKEKVKESAYQDHFLPEAQDDGCISESGKSFLEVRENKTLKKVPITPGSSTWTEFDIVTPKKEDIKIIKEAQAAGCSASRPAEQCTGSEPTKPKGMVLISLNQRMYILNNLCRNMSILIKKVEHSVLRCVIKIV